MSTIDVRTAPNRRISLFRSILSDTHLSRPGHNLHTFQMQHAHANWLAGFGDKMTTVKHSASTILAALGVVQSELVGKAVVLTDGKAGTVEAVWLDELHGLRISIKGHGGRWPISTIKFEQAHQELLKGPPAG